MSELQESIPEVHRLFRIHAFGYEKFDLQEKGEEIAGNAEEKVLVDAERRHLERAISRLKSSFLYSDDTMSEKGYLVESRQLTEALERVVARSEEIEVVQDSQADSTDDSFIQSASCFIINQKLQDSRFVDYGKLLRDVDRNVTKEFARATVQNYIDTHHRT